jgi:hypothetical protein
MLADMLPAICGREHVDHGRVQRCCWIDAVCATYNIWFGRLYSVSIDGGLPKPLLARKRWDNVRPLIADFDQVYAVIDRSSKWPTSTFTTSMCGGEIRCRGFWHSGECCDEGFGL